MAFDACMMRAVLSEYRKNFPEAKIEKVLQPQNDEIDLVIHSGKQVSRLIFNVGPNAPRLQLSSEQKENPLKAPSLCMYLRKNLVGAKIVGVEQPGFDRIAVFTLKTYDEMGFLCDRKLICEIMGKYANLIFTDGEEKILAAMKIIDFAASTVRQVIPGMKYQIPEMPKKIMPLSVDRALFFEKLANFPPDGSGEKFITSTYSGIATQIARELVYRASGSVGTAVSDMDADRFYAVFSSWQKLLIEENYLPTIAVDPAGKPTDYSYMDITYLENTVSVSHFPSFSDLLDRYFAERDRLEHIHQRAHDLEVLLNNAETRTARKLAIQRESLAESEKGETYKRNGDLITANIYRLKRGMDSFTAQDWSLEDCPEVTVALDARLSPAQNAQKMYKLYNKSKTAREVLTVQIATWEAELRYLESVHSFLARATCEQDIIDLRDELYRSGYASKMKGYRPTKGNGSQPLRFVTSGGFTLLVGKNNLQNDHITLHVAEKDDLWFHVKGLPGSHVILLTDGKEPGDADYTEAAGVAAFHSKATGDLVAVDYTRVRNIRKPAGSKPGFVTFKTNYTAFVHPLEKPAEKKQ